MAERTLLVATDGSPAATAAVTRALELAVAMRARVRFVHASSPVAEELFDRYPNDGPTQDQIIARDPILADAAERAADKGVESEVELISASSDASLAAAIAGIASGIEATMIVTGSRGRGTVAGAVLGSVSHNLISEAAVPVLIVHAAD
jgi:nucleotide-binding universal stress UspA family protein